MQPPGQVWKSAIHAPTRRPAVCGSCISLITSADARCMPAPTAPVVSRAELAEWPDGSVLPSHVIPAIPSWAWKALATARGELRLAVESVMEDLEGLSSSVGARNADGGDTSGATAGDAQDEAEESLRVDDLVAPPSQRAAYEAEEFEPDARCEDFELIDSPAQHCETQSGWVMVAHASATWTG
jgi:hypothetical protein